VLSPHEFATLMLVESAPEQVELNRIDLAALLERRLVSFESPADTPRRPALTPTGQFVLEAAARYRQA
jgi:hypothetical protein